MNINTFETYESEILDMERTYPGWAPLLEELRKMLADNPGLNLLDMKEKFGGISVLPAGEAPPEVFQRVLDIFGISSHTCQRCGGEADQKSAGWLFTICDACWPGFLELATALQGAKVPVIVCPGPGEEAAAATLGAQVICLPGVDLGIYGALFQLARGVVANDTGPGHLAAAAGARLISLYGPRSGAAWTPIGANVRLFQYALKWPTVDCVVEATLLMGNTG